MVQIDRYDWTFPMSVCYRLQPILRPASFRGRPIVAVGPIRDAHTSMAQNHSPILDTVTYLRKRVHVWFNDRDTIFEVKG